MIPAGLDSQLHDLAVAVGLLEGDGSLRTAWFADPLGQAGALFGDSARRAALSDLIDLLAPADPSAPIDPDGTETWHSLAGAGTAHEIFLTRRSVAGGGLALGLAVRAGTSSTPGSTPGPGVALTLALGLVQADDGGLHSVVGAPGSPVRVRVDVTVDSSAAAGFEGLVIEAALTPADPADPVTLRVGVQGLRVGDQVLPTVFLDPEHLDRDAVALLQNLLQDRLGRLAADPGTPDQLSALAGHLLPLAGLGGDVPRLPVERIGIDRSAVADWFAATLDAVPSGGGAPGSVWLAHLAGLLGSDTAPPGSGTEADPWRVPVADLGETGRIELTLAVRAGAAGRVVLAGVALHLAGPAGIGVDARAVLIALPLNGPGTAQAVPSATVVIRAPGDPAATLADGGELRVGFLQAGLTWDGVTLRPVLELGSVQFEGHSYDLLDLSNADSVRAAAAQAARGAIMAALGSGGPGARLAVLAGLLPPPGENGAPVADLAALLSAPTRELARVHRARLLDPAHSWAAMLGQLAGLLGLEDPVAGTGTPADPWHVQVAQAGSLTLELAAWTDPDPSPGGGAAGPADLRLGLRVAAGATVGPATIAASGRCEIVRITLPATGPATARLLGRQSAHLTVTGPFTLASVEGIGLSLQGLDAGFDWSTGQALTPVMKLTGLTLHVDGTDVTVPALQVPPAAGFDPGQPDLGLGLDAADLGRVARALLARLWWSLAGDDGFLASGLLGLHDGLPGLPPDWPVPEMGPGGVGGLLADPLEVLRDWLSRLALTVSQDGVPFALTALTQLRRLTGADDGGDGGLEGAGSYAAPWRVDLGALGGGSQLLVWLEPDGPAAGWAPGAAQPAIETGTPDGLLAAMSNVGGQVPALTGLFGGPQGPSAPDRLSDALAALLRRCSDGDGVVPFLAQFPDEPAWVLADTPVDAAHHLLPEHSDAVAQTLAQVGTWVPGPQRAVLLIGPPFTGRASWQPLLAAAEAAQPGATSPDAHFDLRTPPDPHLADLKAVTVAVPWYTADLADPGADLAAVVAQVAAVVGRIQELRSGAPVVLVAHSTAGLAARAFAAANPAQVAGLITIGTPHGPADLTVLDDPTQTDAVRLAARLLDAAQVTAPMRDVAGQLLAVAEGWQATATLPAPASYPRERFAGDAGHDTGGVAALAIAGQLAGDPATVLGAALAAVLAPAGGTAGGSAPPPPSHLAIGLRVGLAGAIAAPGAVSVDVGLRVDVARVPLSPQPAPLPDLAARSRVEVRVDRPGGWLLDPPDGKGVRLRRAELGVTVESGPGAGPVRADAVFFDAGADSPTGPVVTLADAGADRLLSAVVDALATAGPGGTAVVDALVALGVAAQDTSGAAVVLADAVQRLRTDVGGYLGPRLRTVLDTTPGQLGVQGPPGGPWTASGPAPPLTFELAADHLTVRLTELDVAGAHLSADVMRRFDDGTARVTLALAGATVALRFDPAARTLVLSTGLADPVTLVPRPSAAELADRLAPLLLELMITSVGAAALAGRLGPGWTPGPLAQLLVHPGQVLGPLLDGDRVGGLLRAVAGLLGTAAPSAPPGQEPADLALPGGLTLRASGHPGQLSLRTEPPFAVPGVAGGPPGELVLELDVALARTSGAPDVTATVSLDVPLGGTWGVVSAALSYAHGTVSLAITPTSAAGTALAPIVLLPRFGGLGPLAAEAVSALLPAVLDALEARQPQPVPAIAAAVLAVADAIGVHGGQGDPSFAGHAGKISELAGPGGLMALAATGLPAAVAQLWQAAGLPGTVTQAASGVAVQASAGPVTVTVETGWGSTPAVRLRIDGLVAGPISLDPIVVGVTGGTVTGELTAAVALPPAAEQVLGLHLTPALRVEVNPRLTVTALPLGTAGADLIRAGLLPAPGLTLGGGGIAALLEQLAMPLAAQVSVDHLDVQAPLFAGGPALADVLRSAGILDAGTLRLAVPLPPAGSLAARLLAALAGTGAAVRVGSDLDLQLLTDHSTTPPRLGLGLSGNVAVGDGEVDVSLRAGERAPTWLPDPAPALRLLLIEEGTWQVRAALRVAPLGIRLAGADDGALLDTADLHLGAVTAYLWAAMDLDGGFTVSDVGGALDVGDLGLPLGAVTTGNAAANPVAGSLFDSSGGAGPDGGGDKQAVLPGVSLVAARRPAADFALLRREGDSWLPFTAQPLWIAVNRGFGPLTVGQIGIAYLPAPAGSRRPGTAEIFLDGGVQVGPLTVQANELGVSAPLDRLDQPGSWSLDLAGLAVAFSNDSVSMAGGLVKRAGPPIDYAGTLTVEVAGRTFTAVGAYARPADQQGGFTSLFAFVGLPTVLGGPPYMFVTGLGAGGGYDRRLTPPAQVTDVEQFPLVTAIDQGSNADPMGTLELLGSAMVPQRGSYWLAAGIRFTSFSFVRSVAVVYAALDRGTEIGLLGVSRAAIPPPDTDSGSLELASVELALKARFSTADAVLSVQAQLTDNSWLLSRDCQLTGGFAFFMWFRQDQFVLTLGGYHPAFVRPPQFPVVPRLGFHWAVSDAIVVKGEAYFALTSGCVMAGGRLEASYNQSGIYASFVAYADFLIAWDPFHYDVAVGVSVTAGFRLRVCFFACVTFDIHVSLGASVHLLGPPLHGEATVDLEVASVTIAFGNAPHAPLPFLDWDAFRDKYVVAGAPDGSALSVHAAAGLIPPDAIAPASVPAPGTPGSQGNPWRVAGTFSLSTETRLAATAFSVNGVPVAVPLNDGVRPVPAALDLAPMNVAHVSGVHDLSLRSVASSQLVDMSHLDVEPAVGHVPAAVWQITDQAAASAAVIPVLTGLTITGHPTVADDGGRPPISLEVIDFNLQPVPIGLISPPAPAAPAPAPAMPAPATSPPATPEPPAAPARAGAPRLVAVLHPPHHVAQPGTPATRAAYTGHVRVPAGPGADSLGTGVRLEPGILRVWDLPVTSGPSQWLVSGPGAARVVFLDRAGHPLLDHEITPGDGAERPVTAPPGAARAIISALGRPPDAGLSGPGAVSLRAAPAGRLPVCGWQSGSLLVQVAPAALLARGATVHLPSPLLTRRDGRRTSQALVPAAAAIAGRPSCTTCLPAVVDLVLIIVDSVTADGNQGGRPEVSLDGATVGEPTVIAAGRRLHLLYPVTGRESGYPLIRVRVQAGPDAALAGVLGLPGSLDDWIQVLSRGARRHLVPEGPVSPDGPVTIRHQIPATCGEPS